jgi:chemotaxis protein methyltransferase CheR
MEFDQVGKSAGMKAPGSAEPERFRDWIAQRLGLNFDDTKLGFLADVLSRRADQSGLARHIYLDRLEGGGVDTELQALAIELTVPETYFLRHIDQFRAFSEVALPDALAARAPVRTLNVLSAGCASGEEPFSLAILVRERALDPGWKVTIRAVDINPAMLAKAARGCYSAWALRETPADVQQRWFRSAGREFMLDESIRGAVSFQEVNLAQENTELWAPAFYDVIFCRNVLMYFTPEVAQAVVARLTRSLAPGGYLFLGHAETLRGLSNAYHLRHTHGTFYYQRKGAKEDERREQFVDQFNGALRETLIAPARPEPNKERVSESAWAKTWLETVQRASDRIQALTDRPAAEYVRQGAPGPNRAPQIATQLPLVLELLKQERFSDALDLLGRLPAESALDPDIMLLRAALLTHSGQLSAAERASMQLLEYDELNTGAHYLLALCRESAGDSQGALEHDRAAVYLDPSFAMPRLHLGLMARRAGDTEAAHRELGQALVLLKREDTSRLLLFGGGFGRDALIALCMAELKSGGQS